MKQQKMNAGKRDCLLIPCLYLLNGNAVAGWGQKNLFGSGNVEELTRFYSDNGADELLIFDFSSTDKEHDAAIGKIKDICSLSEIPVMAAGNINRVEDVKKLLYAGCSRAILNFSKPGNVALLPEVSRRFGKDKLAVCVSDFREFSDHQELIEAYADRVLCLDACQNEILAVSSIPVILHAGEEPEESVVQTLRASAVAGVSGSFVSSRQHRLSDVKNRLAAAGIPVKIYESRISWDKFKLNDQGLIPVIVQDYKTDEVLMLAYMNQEAFEHTLKSGRMTYWSRSRGELWVKGDTSGHYQYVKSLDLDCDNDTILAKVDQIGAACHTGRHSCFFQELMKKEYDDTNPLRVFQQVYDVILDRKEHPKEGSYTNYLFDKGIDKILKKVGEECTEIVIAAKNPDKEEIKYEISDFLYHVMVLMAEKGVTWEEITRELARR